MSRAIILAAGRGSRLGALTEHKPKCMVDYQGQMLIDYQLKALHDMKKYVVCGYKHEVLMKYLSNRTDTVCIKNERWEHTNMVHSLFCALEFMESRCELHGKGGRANSGSGSGDMECSGTKRDGETSSKIECTDSEDLIVSYSDIAYHEDCVRTLDARSETSLVVFKRWRELWEKRFDDIYQDAESLKISNGFIDEVGKKTRNPEEIQGQYIGLFKICGRDIPRFMQLRSRLQPNKTDNMYMTDYINECIGSGIRFAAMEYDGMMAEIDREQDLSIEVLEL